MKKSAKRPEKIAMRQKKTRNDIKNMTKKESEKTAKDQERWQRDARRQRQIAKSGWG